MLKVTKNFLGKTRDGYEVYDRVDSHFHAEGGLTLELLKEALSYMYANGANFKVKVVHFKRIVGINNCVAIRNFDEVVMVYRKGRKGPTPMVKNRGGEPCKEITIIIRKDKENTNRYTLITAFVGGKSQPEPWDKRLKPGSKELAESIEFWQTHALLYNEELIERLA